MKDLDDLALLREYTARDSQAAFAELVSRRVGFVYSAALRQVGHPHLAEEVAQAVFIILAQKAPRLSGDTILTGWLFRTTRFVALAQTRAAGRRRQREQEAQMQTDMEPAADTLWEQLAPMLDDALAALGEKDRQAVLLRFFENKSLAEVGGRLGTGEDSARKRVSRALEKLNKYFSRRGVASTSAVIAGAMSANSVQAVPAALAKTITAAALAKGAAAGGSTLTLIHGALKLMAWTKAKTAIVIGVGLLLTAGSTAVAVKKIEAYHTARDSWRVAGLNSQMVADAAPQVRILPTKFGPQIAGLSATLNSEKWGGIGVDAGAIVWAAYNCQPGRIVLPPGLPRTRYDFISTLPAHSGEALQRELRTELGLAGHYETRDTDVLLLRCRFRGAAGLKPPIAGDGNDWIGVGHYYCADRPLSVSEGPAGGLSKFLETYFSTPVIDESGITGNFCIDLKWDDHGSREVNRAALRKVLLNQLGLEVVPGRRPVELLIVEKMK